MVSVVTFPETRVAVLEHRGDPRTIDRSVQKFIEWRRKHGLSPAVSATFNVFVTSPDGVASDAFRLDLCAGIERDFDTGDPGIVLKSIPAGRCALSRHVGDEHGLHDAIHDLVYGWLPGSGESPGNFPLFLQRVTFGAGVPAERIVTDIYLPLA